MNLIEVNPKEQSMKRRRRSRTEKLAILKEAEFPGANVAAVARKHGITASLLFSWRRQFQGGSQPEADNDAEVELTAEYQGMLSTIRQREQILELAAKRISEEAESGNMGGYQIACSVNNLVNATGKLQERKLDLLERLALAQETETSKRADGRDPDDVVDFEVERTSEKICYELVKQEVMRKRAEAAARVVGGS